MNFHLFIALLQIFHYFFNSVSLRKYQSRSYDVLLIRISFCFFKKHFLRMYILQWTWKERPKNTKHNFNVSFPAQYFCITFIFPHFFPACRKSMRHICTEVTCFSLVGTFGWPRRKIRNILLIQTSLLSLKNARTRLNICINGDLWKSKSCL